MDDKSSPATTAVNTPRGTSGSRPSDFLFILGGNVLDQKLDFLGVVAQVEPVLLGFETFPYFPNYPTPPIAKSLLELVFETSRLEVIKLEAIHAVSRHLVPEEPLGGKNFCFTINSKSVIEKSDPSSVYFCYCFETIEIIPLSSPWEGQAGIVPVVYCIVSPSSAIEDYEEKLKFFSLDRKIFMRNFWSGKIDYSFACRREQRLLDGPDVADPWSDQIVKYTIPLMFTTVSFPMILGIIAAAIFDKRVIVVSHDRIKRANFVLGLFVFMNRVCKIKYPHPCLGVVPVSIASELVHAPTPLIAAVSRRDKSRKKKRNQDCVFVDLDKGCEDQTIANLGNDIFPPIPAENFDSDIEKNSYHIMSRIDFFVGEILRLTEKCPNFPSAVSAIVEQQSPILTSFFNSSTIQLYLSDRGGAIWLDHCQ